MLSNLVSNNAWARVAGSGAWNDADILEVRREVEIEVEIEVGVEIVTWVEIALASDAPCQ